jgi:hypothetical protein
MFCVNGRSRNFANMWFLQLRQLPWRNRPIVEPKEWTVGNGFHTYAVLCPHRVIYQPLWVLIAINLQVSPSSGIWWSFVMSFGAACIQSLTRLPQYRHCWRTSGISRSLRPLQWSHTSALLSAQSCVLYSLTSIDPRVLLSKPCISKISVSFLRRIIYDNFPMYYLFSLYKKNAANSKWCLYLNV